MELNEFDLKLVEAIHRSKGIVGEGGATFESMFVSVGLEPTEQNQDKIRGSLSKLLSMKYINKVDYGTRMPAIYMTAGRYELEKSDYYRGKRWGRKPLKE